MSRLINLVQLKSLQMFGMFYTKMWSFTECQEQKEIIKMSFSFFRMLLDTVKQGCQKCMKHVLTYVSSTKDPENPDKKNKQPW